MIGSKINVRKGEKSKLQYLEGLNSEYENCITCVVGPSLTLLYLFSQNWRHTLLFKEHFWPIVQIMLAKTFSIIFLTQYFT